jgi:hypothetical protein
MYSDRHVVIVTLSDRKNHGGAKNRHPSPVLKPHVFWGTLQNNLTMSSSGQQPLTLARVQQPINGPMLKPHVFWGTLQNNPTSSTLGQQPSTLAHVYSNK